MCYHFQKCVLGTINHDTKLPLTVWFLVMYLLTQSKNDIAAIEVL